MNVFFSVVLAAALSASGSQFVRVDSIVSAEIGNAHGCAWVDIDNDGFLDLFDSNYNIGSAIPGFLYRNLRGQNFQRLHAPPLTTLLSATPTSAWGDFDNDGFWDVFIPDQAGHNHLFRNQGDGTFAKATPEIMRAETTLRSFAASWTDFDRDGKLDLFVTGSIGGTNRLYRNLGRGDFESLKDIPPVTETTFCMGVAWCDFDSDGWDDLFLIQGSARQQRASNLLFRNIRGQRFERISLGALTTDTGNGLGCAWGDFNSDGFIDVFIPNENGASSVLYQNRGGTNFISIPAAFGRELRSESLAAAWADYDTMTTTVTWTFSSLMDAASPPILYAIFFFAIMAIRPSPKSLRAPSSTIPASGTAAHGGTTTMTAFLTSSPPTGPASEARFSRTPFTKTPATPTAG